MEEFFSLAAGVSEEDLIDTFAGRYGWDLGQIEQLDPVMMAALYKKVKDDTTTEILRRMWLAYLPLMATGVIRQVSFDEYKAKSMAGEVDTRTNAEILAEVEQVRKELRGE